MKVQDMRVGYLILLALEMFQTSYTVLCTDFTDSDMNVLTDEPSQWCPLSICEFYVKMSRQGRCKAMCSLSSDSNSKIARQNEKIKHVPNYFLSDGIVCY